MVSNGYSKEGTQLGDDIGKITTDNSSRKLSEERRLWNKSDELESKKNKLKEKVNELKRDEKILKNVKGQEHIVEQYYQAYTLAEEFITFAENHPTKISEIDKKWLEIRQSDNIQLKTAVRLIENPNINDIQSTEKHLIHSQIQDSYYKYINTVLQNNKESQIQSSSDPGEQSSSESLNKFDPTTTASLLETANWYEAMINSSRDLPMSMQGSLENKKGSSEQNEEDQNFLREKVKNAILGKDEVNSRQSAAMVVNALESRYRVEKAYQERQSINDIERLKSFRRILRSFEAIADFLSQNEAINSKISDKKLKKSLNCIANHKENEIKSSLTGKTFNYSTIKQFVQLVRENSDIRAYRQS